jgi:hypothetical protein
MTVLGKPGKPTAGFPPFVLYAFIFLDRYMLCVAS